MGSSEQEDLKPSRSAKSSPIAEPSLRSTGPTSGNTRTYEPSPPNNFGQTEFPWMSSAEASPVRTSARQGRGPASTASAADYGASIPVSLAHFDPDTSSWRTWQLSLVEGLTVFSETWPRSGLMRNGIAYQLPPLVPLTVGTDSGFWPTPVVVYTRENWTAEQIAERQAQVKAETLAKGKHHTGNGFGMNLAQAVRIWPTPRANDAEKRGNIANDKRNGLPAAVRYWPTPNAGDYRAGMSNAPGRQQSSLPRSVGIAEGVSSGRRGGLNPTWVEWLMGFPLEWSALEPSETPSCRKSRKSSDTQSSKRKRKV